MRWEVEEEEGGMEPGLMRWLEWGVGVVSLLEVHGLR